MALFREPPRCPWCNKIIAQPVYQDYSGYPPHQIPLGDSFLYWEYDEHDCDQAPKLEYKKIRVKPNSHASLSWGIIPDQDPEYNDIIETHYI